ncbi:MAG TPA: aminopeptidase [Anaerolineales bacterium]|nr:aminopeptidase [Anaerolineales bacterium]
MADSRVETLARVLVEHSVRVQPGDRILIEGEAEASPLIRAVFEGILKAGGHPHLLLSLEGVEATHSGFDTSFIRLAGDEQIDFTPTFLKLAYETFEGRIRIHSSSNTMALTNAKSERLARRRRALQAILSVQFQRGSTGEFKWVTTLYPTQAYAMDAEMSLEDYEDFVYKACHVDGRTSDPMAYWRGVEADQRRVVDAFAGHAMLAVRGPSCDLSLSIRDRVFVNSFGVHNMPDGEVFTGPVEESVNGWVRFSYPAAYQNRQVREVELTFKDGRVVEAKASKNEAFLLEMLETDAGARYLGEFAIGMNPGITRHTGNILFDEKIGGTIHMALGAGYPDTGSKNKSAIHWDMVCDMQHGGEISLDGDVVYSGGAFVI